MTEYDPITKVSTYIAASIQYFQGSKYIYILGLDSTKARSVLNRLHRRRSPPGAHCRSQCAGQHYTSVSGHCDRLYRSHHSNIVFHQRDDCRGFRIWGYVSPLSFSASILVSLTAICRFVQ